MKTFPNLINKLIVKLQQSDVFGKYRFYLLTRKLFHEYAIVYSFPTGDFHVPFSQWCFWDTQGPDKYYIEENLPYCSVINTELDTFDFIDLGADVGVMSLLVLIHCKKLTKITAFEPNPNAYLYLSTNAKKSKVPFTPVNQAVSSFNGTAEFKFDKACQSDHEGHLVSPGNGTTEVTTLDSYFSYLSCQKSLAIKIDVEGQESDVIKGSRNVILGCEKVVLFIEIHPDTLESAHMTPEQIFEEVERIRPIKWTLPESGDTVDRNIPFFEQFTTKQYDVIGLST